MVINEPNDNKVSGKVYIKFEILSDLRRKFKAACQWRKINMRDALTAFIRDYIASYEAEMRK